MNVIGIVFSKENSAQMIEEYMLAKRLWSRVDNDGVFT